MELNDRPQAMDTGVPKSQERACLFTIPAGVIVANFPLDAVDVRCRESVFRFAGQGLGPSHVCGASLFASGKNAQFQR